MPPQRLAGLLLLGLVFAASYASANPTSTNVREYKSLCRLFKIAKRGSVTMNPEKEAEKLIHWDLAVKTREDLKNVREQIEKAATFPLNLTGAPTGEEFTIPPNAKRPILRFINMTEPKAAEILEILESKKKAIKEELEKAKGAFEKAVVGSMKDDMREYTSVFKLKGGVGRAQGTVNREVVCKTSTAEGSEAGSTIRTDLMCLCAPGDGTHTKRICGFDITINGKAWATKTVTGFDEYWAAIYQKCDKERLADAVSPTNIDDALGEFQSLLGTGATAPANLGWAPANILGHIHSSTTSSPMSCSGVVPTANAGPCVDYGTGENITWRDQMVEARNAIESAHEKADSAKPIMRRLESLHHAMFEAALRADLAEEPKDTARKEFISGTGDAAMPGRPGVSTTISGKNDYPDGSPAIRRDISLALLASFLDG